LHSDPGSGSVDVTRVVGRDFNRDRPDVLFQVVQIRGARRASAI
jgi:hypothetical protein